MVRKPLCADTEGGGAGRRQVRPMTKRGSANSRLGCCSPRTGERSAVPSQRSPGFAPTLRRRFTSAENKRIDLTNHRVGAPVAQGASHRTGLVLFTSGSSGPRVVTPAAGRFTTSAIPASASSALPGRR